MPKLFSDQSRQVRCPFCSAAVLRPVELQEGQWYDFAGGFCDCGAVFAHDPTARNGGAVFLQALVMATEGDMDRAMGLSEGEDYDAGYVSHYDLREHHLNASAFGTLYFIRLRVNSGT
jgi:hypothetical protein